MKPTASYQVEIERADTGDDQRSRELPAPQISLMSVHQPLSQPTNHQQPPEDQGISIEI